MPGAIDTGIALFLLVFALGFLTVATVCFVLFYRERKAFEIRARSAYLVMLAGISFMGVILKIAVDKIELLFDFEKNVYFAKTVKYFVVVCSTCCYGSRTIRLALLYSPKARKAAPWLLPERNHVVACILLGLASMIAPLYDMTVVGDGPEAEEDFADKADRHLWIISVACQVAVISLNPLAWLVDDIFNLGRELRVMAVVQSLEILAGVLVGGEGEAVTRWIDKEKLLFLGSVVMFSLSVIHPTKQRLYHPMQSSDPCVVRALEKRKRTGATAIGPLAFLREESRSQSSSSLISRSSALSMRRLLWVRGSSERSTTAASRHFGDGGGDVNDNDDEDSDGGDCGGGGGGMAVAAGTRRGTAASSSSSSGSWTYERVMFTPAVSSAFEEFSRKALCFESFLFLRDAAAYQNKDFTDVEGKIDDGHGDGEVYRVGGHVGREQGEQYTSLSGIVREYVMDGAPNEINISSGDKRSILDVYNLGRLGFFALPPKKKRLVFARAYSEIRYLLERNLMDKFISTERFKVALAKDNPSRRNY